MFRGIISKWRKEKVAKKPDVRSRISPDQIYVFTGNPKPEFETEDEDEEELVSQDKQPKGKKVSKWRKKGEKTGSEDVDEDEVDENQESYAAINHGHILEDNAVADSKMNGATDEEPVYSVVNKNKSAAAGMGDNTADNVQPTATLSMMQQPGTSDIGSEAIPQLKLKEITLIKPELIFTDYFSTDEDITLKWDFSDPDSSPLTEKEKSDESSSASDKAEASSTKTKKGAEVKKEQGQESAGKVTPDKPRRTSLIDEIASYLGRRKSLDVLLNPGKKSVTFNDEIQKIERNSFAESVAQSESNVTLVKVRMLDDSSQIDGRHPVPGVKKSWLMSGGTFRGGSQDELSLVSEDELQNEDALNDQQKGVRVRRLTLRRTIALLFAWFCMGLTCEIHGFTISFVMRQAHCNLEEASRLLLSQNGGTFLGAIVGAVLIGYFPMSFDVIMTCALLMVGLGYAAQSWCYSLIYLGVAFATVGAGRGIIILGSLLKISRLWKAPKNHLHIHGLFIGYAAGAMTSTQISRALTDGVAVSYLNDVISSLKPNYDVFRNNINTNISASNLSVFTNETTISVSYADFSDHITLHTVIGLFSVLCASLFGSFCVYTSVQTVRQTTNDIHKVKDAKTDTNNSDDSTKDDQTDEHQPNNANGSPDVQKEANNNNQNNNVNASETTSATTQNALQSETVQNRALSNGTVTSAVPTPVTNDQNGQSSANGAIANNSHKVTFVGLDNVDVKSKPLVSWFVRGQNFDVPTLMFLYIFFSLPLGLESVYSIFLYRYIIFNCVSISESHTSFIIMSFWGGMIVSRLAIIPLAKRVLPNGIMVACFTLNLAASCVLTAYASRYPLLLWIFVPLLGFSLGPLVPAGLTWANVYFKWSAKSLALVICVGCVGSTLMSWLVGFLVEYFSWRAMFYLCLTASCLSLVLYLPVMGGLARRNVFKIKVKRGQEYVIRNAPKTYI